MQNKRHPRSYGGRLPQSVGARDQQQGMTELSMTKLADPWSLGAGCTDQTQHPGTISVPPEGSNVYIPEVTNISPGRWWFPAHHQKIDALAVDERGNLLTRASPE
jgi:hypothetical protein